MPDRRPVFVLTHVAVAAASGAVILAGPRIILRLTRRSSPA